MDIIGYAVNSRCFFLRSTWRRIAGKRMNIRFLKLRLISSQILLCALLIFAGIQSLYADKITLKNGKVIEGRILKEEPEGITIQTPTMSIILQKKEIDKIERDSALSSEEMMGDLAYEDKRYYEALAYYQEALKTAQNKDPILEKIENIRKIQDEEINTRFGQQLSQADRHIELREFDKAEELLNQILANLPHESLASPVNNKLSRLYYQKALEYLNTVNDIKAEECLKKAIALSEDAYEADLLYADLLSRNPRTYNEAIFHYLKGIERGEKRLAPEKIAKYHRSVALLYEHNKQYEEAIRHHKVILEKDPVSYPDTKERIVEAYLYLFQNTPEEDFAKRREYLLDALEVDSYAAKPHFALACLFYHNNLLDDCMKECDKIIELNSKIPLLHYYQAMCFLRRKEYEKAREALERELSVNPENYDALCLMGDFLLNGGKYQQAIGYYEKARDVASEKYYAYLGLAKAYRKLDKNQLARENLEKVFSTNPDHIEANVLSGTLYKDSQEYKKALDLFNNVIIRLSEKGKNLSPELRTLLVEALIQKGEVNLIMENYRESLFDFKRSLEYQPGYAEIYYHMAQANIKLKNYSEAEQNYFTAQGLEPKNPKYYLGLGILYHNQLKKTPKAIENYTKYIELGGEDFAKVNEWIKECGGTPVEAKTQ